MGCSCNNKIKKYNYKNVRYQDENNKTKPFEICPYCAFKHLSYSLVLNNPYQCIGELYLAYKHLQGNFQSLSIKIIDMINRILENDLKISHLLIYRLADEAHELAIKHKENNENIGQIKQLDLDDKLKDRYIVYISAANQLYNHQQGYKDVNYQYVLGMLQLAVEYAPNEDKKTYTRNIWKAVENGQKLNIIDVLY